VASALSVLLCRTVRRRLGGETVTLATVTVGGAGVDGGALSPPHATSASDANESSLVICTVRASSRCAVRISRAMSIRS
jgi:hypothetical protein